DSDHGCPGIGGTQGMVPKDLRYTKEHEWVRVEGDLATVGITDFAAEQLGDVVFVDLPEVGRTVAQFAAVGVIESVKAVSDLFAPVGGDVVETNAELTSKPELLNSDPYGGGWMLRIRLSDRSALDRLLDMAAYEALTSES
ncbi:MAG TPA: glycine cleavage system protein GcvH, partial [Candidatus Limnocylindrales bacterium]